MWAQLEERAMAATPCPRVDVAERCAAGVGNAARASFLRQARKGEGSGFREAQGEALRGARCTAGSGGCVPARPAGAGA